MQGNCVLLFFCGEIITTSIYQTGVANSPDIFQQKNNDLFNGIESIRAYIYELLF